MNFARRRWIRERRRRVPFHLVRDGIEIRIETLPPERRLLVRREFPVRRLEQLRNARFGVPFRPIDIVDPHLIPRHVVRIDEHRTAVFPFEDAVRTIRTRGHDRERVHRPRGLSGDFRLFYAIDVEAEIMLIRFSVRLGPERDVRVFPDAQAQFVGRGFTQSMKRARA